LKHPVDFTAPSGPLSEIELRIHAPMHLARCSAASPQCITRHRHTGSTQVTSMTRPHRPRRHCHIALTLRRPSFGEHADKLSNLFDCIGNNEHLQRVR